MKGLRRNKFKPHFNPLGHSPARQRGIPKNTERLRVLVSSLTLHFRRMLRITVRKRYRMHKDRNDI